MHNQSGHSSRTSPLQHQPVCPGRLANEKTCITQPGGGFTSGRALMVKALSSDAEGHGFKPPLVHARGVKRDEGNKSAGGSWTGETGYIHPEQTSKVYRINKKHNTKLIETVAGFPIIKKNLILQPHPRHRKHYTLTIF